MTLTTSAVATAAATATAALKHLNNFEDNRSVKKRKMPGRPRKHLRPEDAALAKIASDNARYQRRKEGLSSQNATFIMFAPIQEDAPPLTNESLNIRSNLNIPLIDNEEPELLQQAILVSHGRPQVPVPVPTPLPSVQQEEENVEDAIKQLNLQDGIDQEYEAAIALHTLQSSEDNTEPLTTASATALTTTSHGNHRESRLINAQHDPLPLPLPLGVLGQPQHVNQFHHGQDSISKAKVNLSNTQSQPAHAEKQLHSSQNATATAIPTIYTQTGQERHSQSKLSQYTEPEGVAEAVVVPVQSEADRQGTEQLQDELQDEDSSQVEEQVLKEMLESSRSAMSDSLHPFIDNDTSARLSNTDNGHLPIYSNQSTRTNPNVQYGSGAGYRQTRISSAASVQSKVTSWLNKAVNNPPRTSASNESTVSSPLRTSHSGGSGDGSGNYLQSNVYASVLVSSRSGSPQGPLSTTATECLWGPIAQDDEDPPPIVVRLGRQLWQFNGCTEEQHQALRDAHVNAHEQVDSPSNSCCSLPQLTTLITGANADGTPSITRVPDVLGQDRLVKRGEYQLESLNLPAMFEGDPTATATATATADDISSSSRESSILPENPMDDDDTNSSNSHAKDTTATARASTLPRRSPWSLCLDAHHSPDEDSVLPETCFDIDSLCAFPTSLAVAREGINWFPQQYQSLNLGGSVHLGLQVPDINSNGQRVLVWTPLHQIRHFCAGGVIGLPGLLIYFVFPNYNFIRELGSGLGKGKGTGRGSGSGSKGKTYSTLLTRKDEVMLIDEIILPAIFKNVTLSNVLQYYPATAAIIKADARATGSEQYIKIPQSREQFLSYPIQAEFLDALWLDINKRIEAQPRFACFSNLTLFLNQKNTKINYMGQNFTSVIRKWQSHWNSATDPEFLNAKQVYIDIGKQVTSPSVNLPGRGGSGKAETFLYRKCCLGSFFKRWSQAVSDGDVDATATASEADTLPDKVSDGFTQVSYMWATLRDAGSQTIASAAASQAFSEGYIYGQFYNIIKAPFDSMKVYIFNNDNLENIALDPAYIQSLNQAGGSTSFSQKAGLISYLASKNRAHVNVVGNTRKSYGIREEHRVSLELAIELCHIWEQWQQSRLPPPTPLPLAPYYAIPSSDIFRFLRAQMNKYCLLFEYVLAHTNKTHSLPEFIIMVLALRALRFSYSSSTITREGLLYKDQWQRVRKKTKVTLEGIGMGVNIAKHGIGWFLPKINWQTFRVVPPHLNHFLAGNVLLHSQYQRRWRAVRDLRDVFIRLSQVDEWFTRHNLGVGGSGSGNGNGNDRDRGQRAWLDFLHGLNLNQFDHDVAGAMEKSHKLHPELAQDYKIEDLYRLTFSYEGMIKAFGLPGLPLPPHSITGNKARFRTGGALIDFLFGFDDGLARASWGSMTYRLIYQRSCEMIKRHLGREWQRQWRTEFKFLLQLTHWVLPHANDQTFLNLTKSNQSKSLVARTSWFSTVYREPHRNWLKQVDRPPRSLSAVLAEAESIALPPPLPLGWEISSLLKACRSSDLCAADLEKYSVLGRQHQGTSITSVWERGQPARLWVSERIRDKTLDELEVIFSTMLEEERAKAPEPVNVFRQFAKQRH